MMKVMDNDQLEYKLAIWVFFFFLGGGVFLWKEKEALSLKTICIDMDRVECVLNVWVTESIILY